MGGRRNQRAVQLHRVDSCSENFLPLTGRESAALPGQVLFIAQRAPYMYGIIHNWLHAFILKYFSGSCWVREISHYSEKNKEWID